MGFKDAKRQFLEALREQRVSHEQRATQSERNWVASGRVSLDEAHAILSAARGGDSESAAHHLDPGIEIWIFKPKYEAKRWYVKGYLIDEEFHLVELRLMSFHPSERSS